MHFQKGNKTIILRGVNLADGKFPKGQPTYLLSSLDPNNTAPSYLDTPLDLKAAPHHLQKLRYLGFNVLRVPVVWEALEPHGPGGYDDSYIEHVHRLVQTCRDHGFEVIINPHQDLWSRHAGGSGAPLWTLHACGLDPRHFTETHAALRYCEWPPTHAADNADNDPRAAPNMLWTTDNDRLAAATLFALFFAGRDFAPRCRVDGVNIQDYLQGRYFAAYARLAARLGDLPFGYDSMNEPSPGYVGWTDLGSYEKEGARIASAPTPIQSFRLGMGMAQDVDEYRLGKMGPHKVGTMKIEPGNSCWLKEEDPRWKWNRDPSWPLGTCVWALHDVWDTQTGELKKPNYFAHLPHTSDAATKPENESDKPLSFISSYWQEYHQKWTAMLRQHSTKPISFIQPPIFEPPPPQSSPLTDGSANTAHSPHFYDALTVMRRHWHARWNVDIVGLLRDGYKAKVLGVRLGKEGVRRVISDELGQLADDARRQGMPALIGETGIPFDLDEGKAYRDGDYSAQVKAMDAILSGCDDHLLSCAVWAYSALNTHEWGDGWNGEDLSIFSTEDGSSFGNHPFLRGFRAPAAYCRPYAQSLTGEPVSMSFDYKSSRFALQVRCDGPGEAVVYVPWLHYRRDDEGEELALDVKVTEGGEWSVEGQRLIWKYQGGGKLELERAGGALSERRVGTIVA